MSGRFAALEIDVDLDERLAKKKSDKKDDSKKQPKLNQKKKNKPSQDHSTADLQAMAFGVSKKKGGGESGHKKKKDGGSNKKKDAPPSSQVNGVSDDWKRRDEEFVQMENERSLKAALLQSKLEFEEKRDTTVGTNSSGNTSKVKKKNKESKTVTLTLEEFNSLSLKEISSIKGGKDPDGGSSSTTTPHQFKNESKFFEDLDDVAKRTLTRDQMKDTYKATANQYNEEVRSNNYENEIEKRDFEIQALRLEVEALKEDLTTVRTRNKKLCEVMGATEMREKAEIALEVRRLEKVKDELSTELCRLAGELEQERSKSNTLTLQLKKAQSKGKKKHNVDTCSKE